MAQSSREPIGTPSRNASYSVPSYDPQGLSLPVTADEDSQRQQRHQAESSASWSRLVPGAKEEPTRHGRRGRRRRSSEAVQQSNDSRESDRIYPYEEHATTAATNPQSLLWWQRKGDVHEDGERHAKLPPLDTNRARTAIPSSPTFASLRSPAATFLSSMNESLGSPPPPSSDSGRFERRLSQSPPTNETTSDRGSVHTTPSGRLPRHHSVYGSEASPFGLGSAAVELYGNPHSSNSRSPDVAPKSDAEGSRIGVNGQYLLGKTIGFGGFSTIREAWVVGSTYNGEGDQESLHSMHRVAVKIQYSTSKEDISGSLPDDDELRIWERIPAHPNLLPLLYFERARLDVGSEEDAPSIIFLVMPFCQGSLLTFVKTEGSLVETIDEPAQRSGADVSRSGSLRSGGAFILSETPNDRSYQNRTGSGFVPRNAVARMASVPLPHLMGRSPSSVGSSSSLIRRASSRISRPQRQSNGVPFRAARSVMKQLVDALVALHCKASVLHGDLKLENVLGQVSVSRPHRRRNETSSSNGDAESSHSNSHRMFQNDDEAAREHICWRIADFGSSSKITRKSGVLMHLKEERERLAILDERRSKTESQVKAGGSLAYTAPEVFLPSTLNSASVSCKTSEPSPFAADMWALGCILYALCSGKLPFADSFEPRLQMKIAKGKWDMPQRLKRRGARNFAETSDLTDVKRAREPSDGGARVSKASDSASRTSSLSTSFAGASRLPRSSSGHNNSISGAIDMSASMPALQERTFLYEGRSRTSSQQSLVVHDGKVRTEHEEGEEEGVEETSAESDADDVIDRDTEGTSHDRVQIRLALRHLLEPDPSKRWTIEQLARLPWITGSNLSQSMVSASSVTDEEGVEAISAILHEDAPSSSFLDRPNLAFRSISEHASQEQVPTTDEESMARGRSKRREAGGMGSEGKGSKAARPIDIDRSSSRSRSRPGLDRYHSSPWKEVERSEFERRYHQNLGWSGNSSDAERRRVKRSASADTHASLRGRSSSSRGAAQRSVSRPPRIDMGDVAHALPTSMATDPRLPTTSTSRSSENVNRSSTSRSRSRARDALNEIASRGKSRESSPAATNSNQEGGGGEEKLWWQRGRRSGQ